MVVAGFAGIAGLFAGAQANVQPLNHSITNELPRRGRVKRSTGRKTWGRWRKIQQWAFGRRDFDSNRPRPAQNKRLKAAAVKSCARGIAIAHRVSTKPATLARIERRVRRTWS